MSSALYISYQEVMNQNKLLSCKLNVINGFPSSFLLFVNVEYNALRRRPNFWYEALILSFKSNSFAKSLSSIPNKDITN